MRLIQLFKTHYMFHAHHTRVVNGKRMDYAWRYWTDNLDLALTWYNIPTQFWNLKSDRSSSALYIAKKDGMQLIKSSATNDYSAKAYLTGKMWWELNQRVLEPSCFGKFATKGSDFTIFNSPSQVVEWKHYKGHSAANYQKWQKEMKVNNKNSVIFWPKPNGKGYHLQYWG